MASHLSSHSHVCVAFRTDEKELWGECEGGWEVWPRYTCTVYTSSQTSTALLFVMQDKEIELETMRSKVQYPSTVYMYIMSSSYSVNF